MKKSIPSRYRAEEEIRETGGLPALVGLSLVLAAGPLAAPHLPAGPASLLDPAGASVGIAVLAGLWLLFVWPAVTRRREPGPVLRSGASLLLAAIPFVAGPAFASGVGWRVPGAAAAVLVGTAAVSAAWMLGPGRERRRDRGFVAAAILVLAAAPLANYALNEFAASSARLGYRLSPPLLLRRILLEARDADPVPYLLLCLAATAALLAFRFVRPKALAAAALLLLASTAGAAEVRPLLGEGYVPGRALPLLATAETGEERVRVTVPGRLTATAPARSGGSLVFVPAPAALAEVTTGDGRTRSLRLTPVAPGTLLVVLGPVSGEVRARARTAGLFLSRAAAGAEREDLRAFLAADLVLDPGGLLPGPARESLRAAGVPVLDDLDVASLPSGSGPLRRPWEERGRVLSGAELDRLFFRRAPWDRAVAERVFLLLSGFALVLLAFARYLRRARFPAAAAPVLLLVLCGTALAALRVAAPESPAVREDRLEVRAGGRSLTLYRFSTRRGGEIDRLLVGPPVPLGPPSDWEAQFEPGGGCRLRLALGARQSRIVAVETPDVQARLPGGPFDFEIGPDGLARSGEEPVGAADFLLRLAEERGGPTPEAFAIRKLLRLAGTSPGRYGVLLPSAERPVLEVVPLGR